ncbi:thiol-disulfide oxidoreductase DCC family protein [Chitinophaga vietnamensis]|uniref:thiol-disulfide oxidoreductase DCC family protein n=1 Tax=Chitinophaga vietnamensis TaxID=2593957 RepID=UPI0011773541|nr:thiol-disulfide oxidoreductase DCC family protein [Chitinophaga vietnamensis]
MQHAIILFDGVCNFCNSSVNFVIRHDRRSYFRFAPLQSDIASALSVQYHFPLETMASFVLVENAQAYTKSTAALKVCRHLPFPWRLAYVFMAIPRPLRDGLYSWIARNRYRWFGRQEACMMPTPDVRSRFLQDS